MRSCTLRWIHVRWDCCRWWIWRTWIVVLTYSQLAAASTDHSKWRSKVNLPRYRREWPLHRRITCWSSQNRASQPSKENLSCTNDKSHIFFLRRVTAVSALLLGVFRLLLRFSFRHFIGNLTLGSKVPRHKRGFNENIIASTSFKSSLLYDLIRISFILRPALFSTTYSIIFLDTQTQIGQLNYCKIIMG